ncbi:hypothetical protein Ddye_011565 [Dipteronia dyeriana]|uniref:Uncharacterized protein n=1 Tax=Dipteronia dyeriana TaxID=168575 RepID=A0AAD9X2Q9_9ROSI|nr:hypothetical protein Ddye_011565 [Dipteronia dyeriana]
MVATLSAPTITPTYTADQLSQHRLTLCIPIKERGVSVFGIKPQRKKANFDADTELLAARKHQSALRSVIEQPEKAKIEKKKPAAVHANKRVQASNGGPMPPAKAGRSTNAYVSSFPVLPTFVRSPSHSQHPAGVSPYQFPSFQSPSAVYGSRIQQAHPYAYSPPSLEAAPPPLTGSYPGAPMNYPA